jgi:transcriptional regulator with XRE-family HTH domain
MGFGMIHCMSTVQPGPLGRTIEERLENLGWSQNELARRAGIDSGTVSRLIRGVHEPTMGTLESIAKALDLNPVQLFRLAGIPIPVGQYDDETAYIAQRLAELRWGA